MLPVLLLFVLAASCTKQQAAPRHPAVTTTVDGLVLRRFTRAPMAGVTVTLEGWKPYESSGLCLFCPDSTSFDIASIEQTATAIII